MIDQTQIEALQASLSEDCQSLYAILDGASLPNLVDLFAEHGVPHVCLLPGEIDPELARAAPYLAQLTPQSTFAELFLGHGLGQHWGILATSDADFRTQRMHFRQLLSVWDDRGRPLYFRYYDPRVLRVYLPTCNGGELRTFFGPVSAFYAEGESPGTLLRFVRGGDRLGLQPLPPAVPAAPNA